MHIIIIGGGNIGENLAQELAKQKHDVVVIEKEKVIAERLASELNAKVICGDGQEREILMEGGIKKADVLVCVTDREETNLMACLVAKELRPAVRMIVRSGKKEFYKIFYRAGITEIISPEASVAEQVSAVITQPDIRDLVMFHEDVDLIQYAIKEGSHFVDHTVKNIQEETPDGSMLIAIRRGKEFMIPQLDVSVMPGDIVIFITKKENIKTLNHLFD